MATPFRLKRSSITGKRPNLSDLQLGELALNFYDGYLFAERDTAGVGIGTTVALLTPWTENFGAGSIYYQNSVAIGGTTVPTATLTVFGSSYVSENFNTKTLFASTVTSNNGIFTSFSVSGVSTFTGLLDANGGAEIDNIRIGVANDNTIDTSTGGLTLDSNSGTVTVDDNLAISGTNTLSFNSNSFNISHSGGNANVFNGAGDLIFGADGNRSIRLERVGVASLARFTHGGSVELYFDGSKKLETTREGIFVSGLTTTLTLSVTGVSTFSGDLDINAAIDVDGHTELDELNVSGVSTTQTLNVGTGGTVITTTSDGLVGINSTVPTQKLDIVGTTRVQSDTLTQLETLLTGSTVKIQNTSSTDTIAPSVTLQQARNLSNFSFGDQLGSINYTDQSSSIKSRIGFIKDTSGSAITLSANYAAGGANALRNGIIIRESGNTGIGTTNPTSRLHVVGNTLIQGTLSLTELNVSGVSTFNSDAYFRNNIYLGSASNETQLFENTGSLFVRSPGNIFLQSTSGEQYAAFIINGETRLYYSNSKKFETTGYGVTVYDTLQTQRLNVSGVSTFTGDLDINAAIDVDGHTELDELRVTGVSTFTADLDINAAIDVDGHTELDELRVTGVSTFTADLDINAAIDVDGHTELDELNVTGIATFANAIDANGGLDVFGQTELDDLNVSGIATINSLSVSNNFDVYDTTATFHSNVFIAGNLSIGGTATTVIAQDLKVFDREITLGITTNALGQDVSNDITANHGGIAIASTEGSPLVNLTLAGFSSIPPTYKQLMWVAANSYGVGTTDAWMFNYAVGIGSTQVPNNVRLAVSEIQFTDNTISSPRIVVSGISTFGGLIDANGGLDVTSHTELDELNVSGLSTFTADLDINAAIDVDGHTELDELRVTGVSTFTADLDINAAIDVDGHTELDELRVTGVSTFTSDLDINAAIDVDGHTELDELRVTGVSTFTADLDINAAIDVDGHTELDELRVTGVSTFTADLDINAAIDVDGHTELDELRVSGVSTFLSDLDINAAIDVDGHTELDELNVSGVSTFLSDLDINAAIDVDGHTELDELNVSGVSTFVGIATFGNNVFIQNQLFVGGIEITGGSSIGIDIVTRNFKATGISTFVGIATAESTLFANQFSVVGPSTFIGVTTNRSTLFANQFSVSGVSTFAGFVDVNGGLDVTGHTELDNLNVSGVSTFASDLDINAAIDVDGHTELDELRVTGVSTFTADLDINAAIDVDGHTELDELRVTGVSTFTADLDINAAIDVDGHTELDELRVTGVSTFTADLDINAAIDVDGHTELDELRVSGVSTFLADLNISGAIDVDGHTELDELRVSGVSTFVGITTQQSTLFANQLSVAGVSTFASNLDINAAIDVDGHTELDELRVTGVSTFTADLDINAAIDVDGHTELDELRVTGVSTFTADLDINAAIDVDGHTELDELRVSGVSTFVGITTQQSTFFATLLSVSGVSTFASDLDINAAIDVDGHTELDELRVTGVSTFTADLDINAAIDVDGHTELDELNVSGVSTFASLVDFNGGVDISGHLEIDNVIISGVTTFTNTTNNTLGDFNTGAVQIDGGLGVEKNVTVGAGLSVAGDFSVNGQSIFVGIVTFQGGTIKLGDSDTDDINVGGEFTSSLVPNTDNTYDLGTLSKQWRNIYINGIADVDDLNVSGITTTILFNVGVGGTVITTTAGGRVGINSTSPGYALDVGGDINSSTDIKINGTSVLVTASNDAVALAIALG